MDYLATASALNESYTHKDWDRFCKYALPVAVAAAQERFLRLYAAHQRATPPAEWFQDMGKSWDPGRQGGGGKYGSVPRNCQDSSSHQLGIDRYYARQEAEDAAHDALVYLVSSDLSFDNPDRMYRVVQVRARFAAERRHREEHGDKDRPGRLARQEQWFRERYSVNSYTDTDCDGESFAVQEVVERDQPEQLDKLADLEEAQLVRDTLLSSTESWAEVLAAHYLEGVSIPGLQERYGLRRSHMYQRLADARLALQSSLSTSTYV